MFVDEADEVPVEALLQPRVESEIAFLLARDITGPATIASVLIGVAMFGSTVYLSQYFQLSRGMSPTQAGLMSMNMVLGLAISAALNKPIEPTTFGVFRM